MCTLRPSKPLGNIPLSMASNKDTQKPNGLLSLPPELLSQIYSHLLPPASSSTAHPLPNVGITSVSPSPPPLSLLLVHPYLTSTLLEHYYTLATWKLVLSHSFNFFRTDPELDNLAASAALKRFKRVELVYFLDALLVQEYPSFGIEAIAGVVRKRAERACDVLGLAAELRHLKVSWMDTTDLGSWDGKKSILEPLRKLRGVEAEIGEIWVLGLDGHEKQNAGQREDVVRAIEEVLGPVTARKSGSGMEREGGEVKVLEVDVRQQRFGRPGGAVDAVRLS